LLVGNHELAIRQLTEQHTKLMQDIQENQLKPLEVELSEISQKNAKAME
jgi:hypothetical protein